jgi:hypothetical protein
MAYLYGMLSEKDLAANRVTEIGVSAVQEAVDQSNAEHNRQINALISLFVERTQNFKVRYQIPTAARLQPLDASGRARPIKPAGNYDVAFPIYSAGAAWGSDYVTGVKMRVGDVALITTMMQDADMRWVRDHILAGLFFKNGTSGWTFTDEVHGALTVMGLANGDTVTYQVAAGADTNATDDHLLTTAAVTAATFITIRDELREHPENGNDVVALIPTNLRTTVEALTGYYPIADPNLRIGTSITELIGRLGVAVPGEVIGYIDGVWVVEWKSLPNDNIIARAIGGPAPLAMREDEEPELRGFNRVADRNDHPWYERQYLRRAGFGGWNRVGALVIQVTGGAYAIPTGYTSPMA